MITRLNGSMESTNHGPAPLNCRVAQSPEGVLLQQCLVRQILASLRLSMGENGVHHASLYGVHICVSPADKFDLQV